MITILKKNNLIIASVIINLILISVGGMEKGRMSFISIPIILLINLVFFIYALIKKNQKLILTSIVLFFVSPAIAILVFITTFPFLTR